MRCIYLIMRNKKYTTELLSVFVHEFSAFFHINNPMNREHRNPSGVLKFSFDIWSF